ncbi:MAG: substrate-binding domain-containing protein [Lentisphaerae bacterium]|jgi:DNA-binding LacI/PurR family transcriptional regulator|nr:substrate-binding domain-containing protein [Lentisphaerota bacterium]
MKQRRNKSWMISEHLRKGIRNGKYPPGSLLSSSVQLAESFGVAPLTANRALNTLAAEGLVIRKQGRGSFVADKETIQDQPVYRIGIADTINYTSPAHIAAMKTFSESMIQFIRNMGHQAQVFPYSDIRDETSSQSDLNTLKGLLLSAAYHDEKTEKVLVKLDIPIVLYLRDWLDDAPFHQVTSDFAPGMREAVNLLQEQNCKQLLIFSETHANGQARRQAFLRELSKANADIAITEEVAFKERSIQGIEVYKKGLEMAEKIRGSSIFCTSDIMAFLLVQAFLDKGLELRQDYQLISVDNLEAENFLPFGRPILTSIDYPRKTIARKAVELLLSQIENPDDCRHIIRVPTRLVCR